MPLQDRVLELMKTRRGDEWDSWTDELIRAIPEEDIALMNSDLYWDVASFCRELTRVDFKIGLYACLPSYWYGNNPNTTIYNMACPSRPYFFKVILNPGRVSSIVAPFETFAVPPEQEASQRIIGEFREKLLKWPFDSRDWEAMG